jgi:predicted Zn-dependent protease
MAAQLVMARVAGLQGSFTRPAPRARTMPLLRRIAIALAALLAAAQPVQAQSILRDAETEAFFHDMGAPLIRAANLSEKSVEIYLIGDRSINAFVAEGQNVFFNAGLLEAADNVNQVQGVMAHELGHIAGGDILRAEDAMKGATGITILSLLLGIAAIAAGAGAAGSGILAAGQQAALGSYLAFSRTQESEADQAGAAYLEAAGISGRGSIDFFKKLQNQEFRLGIPQTDAYARTHPLSGDRIRFLEDTYQASPHWDTPPDPALEARFQRVKGKLIGFIGEPQQTMRLYPLSDTSAPARLARAYAFHKQSLTDRAVAEVDALLAADPADPYAHELRGQVLLEAGRPHEAIASLRQATEMTKSPIIASMLGHALISTEEPEAMAEAKQVLRAAIARDNQNPFAWYQLGVVYDREGDTARAALATAERFNLSGAPGPAFASARTAVAGLPEGSPDWLRAQDILLVSQAQLEKRGRNNRRRPSLGAEAVAPSPL